MGIAERDCALRLISYYNKWTLVHANRADYFSAFFNEPTDKVGLRYFEFVFWVKDLVGVGGILAGHFLNDIGATWVNLAKFGQIIDCSLYDHPAIV